MVLDSTIVGVNVMQFYLLLYNTLCTLVSHFSLDVHW